MSLSGQALAIENAAIERVLATELGLTLTVAEWLTTLSASGGPSQELVTSQAALQKFLDPRLAHLTAPDAMIDRKSAAERLTRALEREESITIFGDYDCDGMTATAIMTEALRELGGRVTPLLASRFDGGYGVSLRAVERIRRTRSTLLVTCDCGSSDHPSLELLRDDGVDVIVVDHHLVPEKPLPALAFLNPHRKDCGFPYKGLASCGLVFSLLAAVRQRLRATLDLRRWLDLVAIGTIADVAPLDGDNRALVRAGLERVRSGARPGLAALLRSARLDGFWSLGARDIAFVIAPRLNAPGRVGAPDAALDLLLARDTDHAAFVAATIEELSVERRRQQDEILAQCLSEIEQEGYGRDAALVLGRQGWNPGIVGIVAGRLADQFGLPAIVVGLDGERGRGSVRGPTGSRLFDALYEVQTSLLRFGGHQAAAGVEIEASRLGELRRGFSDVFARSNERDGAPAPQKRSRAIAFNPLDDPRHVLRDFYRLEPCWEANPKPSIIVDCSLQQARVVGEGHLKLSLRIERERAGETHLSAFAVGQAKLMPSLVPGAPLRVLGDLRPDRWLGGDAVELFVENIACKGMPECEQSQGLELVGSPSPSGSSTLYANGDEEEAFGG